MTKLRNYLFALIPIVFALSVTFSSYASDCWKEECCLGYSRQHCCALSICGMAVFMPFTSPLSLCLPGASAAEVSDELPCSSQACPYEERSMCLKTEARPGCNLLLSSGIKHIEEEIQSGTFSGRDLITSGSSVTIYKALYGEDGEIVAVSHTKFKLDRPYLYKGTTLYQKDPNSGLTRTMEFDHTGIIMSHGIINTPFDDYLQGLEEPSAKGGKAIIFVNDHFGRQGGCISTISLNKEKQE